MSSLVWTVHDPESIAGGATQVFGSPVATDYPTCRAVRFDGERDGLLLAANPLLGSDRFSCTVEFFPEVGGAVEQRFFHVGTPHGDRALLELRMNSDDSWYLDVYLSLGGCSLALRDSGALHPPERWYSATLAFDGRTLSGLVDGEVELAGTMAAPTGERCGEKPPAMTGNHCSIGMRQNGISFFKGSIRKIIIARDKERV